MRTIKTNLSALLTVVALATIAGECPMMMPPGGDTTKPTIVIVIPIGTVSGDPTPAIVLTVADEIGGSGVNNGSLAVDVDGTDISASCVIADGQATCESPDLDAGEHTINASIADNAGNVQTAAFMFDLQLDTAMPTVMLVNPMGTVSGDRSPEIVLSLTDEAGGSGINNDSLDVDVDGTDITGSCVIAGGQATCESPELEAGQHTINASVADNAGNVQTMMFTFDLVLPLDVDFTFPPAGLLTNMDTVQVEGTVTGTAAGVMVNNVAATLTGDDFSAEIELREGINDITATAEGPSGETGVATVRVTRDTTAPSAVISMPLDGQTLSASSVTITGQVLDVVVGPVTEDNCRVTISGRTGTFEADIASGTFILENFPLVNGENTITATPTDAVGNEGSPVSIEVTRQTAAGQRLVLISGDNLMGVAGAPLPNAVSVQAIDANGSPLPGRLLEFAVSRNDGKVDGLSGKVRVRTDANGMASVQWTLGKRAGLGNNLLKVSAPGFPVPLTVCASAQSAACEMLVVEIGQTQVGVAGQPLARAFVVVALDGEGNRCPDQVLNFAVEAGGGTFDGLDSVEVTTGEDGSASALLTLGQMTGVNNNKVRVTAVGSSDPGVLLLASAEAPDLAAATRFTGLVLDSANDPIVGATVSLHHVEPEVETTTNADGIFELVEPPLGNQILVIDGSTASIGGPFPGIEFFVDILPGVENSLGRPIFLPALDEDSFQTVGGDQDVVLTAPGIEGFSLKVFANSADFPGDETTGLMAIAQVDNDVVPMPPNGGSAPPLVGTFQPAGVHFDPPVQMTIPNATGLPAGQIIDMFSFDHALGMYVDVGTGTVQPDGLTIVSDPGSGIRVSGWYGGSPPPPPPSQVENTDDLLTNKDIQQAFQDALNDSNPGVMPLGPMGEHEEGGWIIQDAEGNIRTQRWPVGDGDSITPVAPVLGDGEVVVSSFHTHPDNPNFEESPSQADIDGTDTTIEDFGLDPNRYLGCFVVSCNQIWRVDPDGNVRQVSMMGPNGAD